MSKRLFGVIGSGTMGAGIAHSAAAAGFVVRTLDKDRQLVEAGFTRIKERLDRRVADGKLPQGERDETLSRLHVAEGLDCLKDAEVVVEAVSEDLALKRKIFTELDPIVSDRTLLATNTSSLSITRIAEGLTHSDRFIGMHFFNPAPVMKLVELVCGPKTGEQAVVDARAVCAKLEKTAVKVTDSPGFIGNRVNRPFYLEALNLLEQGEADVRTIDAAMREVGGFRMGPFELLDLIGLDINLRVTETVYNDFDKPERFKPNAIQQRLVADGHFGRKSGRGFYDHANGKPTPAYEARLTGASSWQPTEALRQFAAVLGRAPDRTTWVFARIFMAVMNEAALVADSIALPRDVNLTMELGFNYPEGPLATADHVGLVVMQKLLADYYQESGRQERYKANPLLDRRVADGDVGEEAARGFLYHAL